MASEAAGDVSVEAAPAKQATEPIQIQITEMQSHAEARHRASQRVIEVLRIEVQHASQDNDTLAA